MSPFPIFIRNGLFCVQEVKKLPYIPFTEEQKVLANSVDLEDFLRLRGERLERAGR